MDRKSVDVVIPSYQPGEKFARLIEMLGKQTVPPEKIIVINTEEKFWKKSLEKTEKLEVHHIKKGDFDHGASRNLGASYSQADILLFMTDDAVPADGHMIENLLKGFEKKGKSGQQVIMSYGRQLPAQDCGILEKYTRSFNYPASGRVKTAEDLKEMGIKTFFASNVCCAYDRKLFLKQGGFINRTIFNEDMIFAGRSVKAGFAVCYAADAGVIHSHNLTGLQQFHRNFDLAVSQADHPEVFAGISSESEGIRLVKKTAVYLLRCKKAYLIPKLIWQSGWKFMGYQLGKRYQKLPRSVVLWCSMNRKYWDFEKGRDAV